MKPAHRHHGHQPTSRLERLLARRVKARMNPRIHSYPVDFMLVSSVAFSATRDGNT